MLACPDFLEIFFTCADASDYQMRAMIFQKRKYCCTPVLFHSRKLNKFQRKHTTINKELLSIEDVLTEYRNLLLAMKIVVLEDYQNLTRDNALHASAKVQRHRLIIEEQGVQL